MIVYLLILQLIFLGSGECSAARRRGRTGGRPSSCETMSPGHGPPPRILGFKVTSNQSLVSPGQNLAVKISGGDKTFKGLMLQVRNSGNGISGTWSYIPADNFEAKNCANVQDTVLHTNGQDKTEANFVWTAPATCAENEQFKIRATIVVSTKEWEKAEQQFTCNGS